MTTIKSTFNKSDEGWAIGGDASTAGFQSSGGNPRGYLGWTDAATGGIAYFVAPEKFLGDMSAFFGGRISYDIFDTSGDDINTYPDIGLVGGGHTIYGTVPASVGTGWTHETIRLSAAGGWTDADTGQSATNKEIKAVLAGLETVIVRAEYFHGQESGGLDNFLFATPKAGAPSSMFAQSDHGAQTAVHHDFVAAAPLDHGHHQIA